MKFRGLRPTYGGPSGGTINKGLEEGSDHRVPRGPSPDTEGPIS